MRPWFVFLYACGSVEAPVSQTPFRPQTPAATPVGEPTPSGADPVATEQGADVSIATNTSFRSSSPLGLYSFTLAVPTAIGVSTNMQVRLTDTPSSQVPLTAGAIDSLALSLPSGTYYLVVEGGTPPYSLQVDFSVVPSVGLAATCGTPTNSCTRRIVPAPNGVSVEQQYDTDCPAGMDRVASFCIDRFEAMVVALDDASNESTWSPYANPGTQRIRAKSVPNAIPQGYINRTQAASACSEAGKRLCTSDEWLRACKGTANNDYPYGPSRQDGVCNDARAVHPAVQYFGTSADCVWSSIGDACINQLSDGLSKTGAHIGCVSADGQRDMMGNLHEWVSDTQSNGNGIFRGGYYVDTKLNFEGCNYRTTAHAPSHWDYSTGFRCCK